MTSLDLPKRPRILVITLRRLGDVLLTTPLIRTLKTGFAGSSVTALVFHGTEGMLAGNPDVDEVIATSHRPSFTEMAGLVRRMWRKYDLAVSTQAGDRPTFFALMSAPRRVGLVPHTGQTGAWWKRYAHHVPVPADPDCHRVTQLLGLATALGLKQEPDIVCPQGGRAEEFTPRTPYAVVHASPFYRYKRWTDAGWRGLARGLAERGLALVATEERGHLCRARHLDDPPGCGQRLPHRRAVWSHEPPADRTVAPGGTGRALGSFRHSATAWQRVGGTEPAPVPPVREARLRGPS